MIGQLLGIHFIEFTFTTKIQKFPVPHRSFLKKKKKLKAGKKLDKRKLFLSQQWKS